MSLLKRHRLANGLTIQQLARKCGVTGASAYAWEAGLSVPKPKHIPKLARALGLTPMDLISVLHPQPPAVVASAV